MSILLDGTQGIDFNDGSNQSTAATPYARKNLIINGDMRIAQRGTSTTGITTNTYTVDRHQLRLGTLGTWTMSQDTDVPTGQGFSNSVKIECTTADASPSASAFCIFNQIIEGQNLQHLKYGTSNAESLTLSFWIKSNKTGTYINELWNTDGNRAVSKAFTIDSSNTWEKKTVTFEGDTVGTIDNDNGASFYARIWLGAGSTFTSGTLATAWQTSTSADKAVGQVNLADSTSNYINITGLQLEVNDSASDFEFVPYDMELARCQRYYERSGTQPTDSYSVSDSSNNTVVVIHHKVTKRVTGTLHCSGSASGSRDGNWNYIRSGIGYTAGSCTPYRMNIEKLSFYVGIGATYAACNLYGWWEVDSEL